MRILVTGGRNYHGRDHVLAVLEDYLEECPTIVHGAQKGADRLAGIAAEELRYPVDPHPADWKTHGLSAGPIRNRQMLDTDPDLVIAFPGGKGTDDCVGEAIRRGILVRDERRYTTGRTT